MKLSGITFALELALLFVNPIRHKTLLAITYATHLAFIGSVNELPHFDQSNLRPQLTEYLEQQNINVFK